jgi:hypothetical protein
MSKYTPGKWKRDGWDGVYSDGVWLFVANGANESDALLASKSPEMYEMLKRLEWSQYLEDITGAYFCNGCAVCGKAEFEHHAEDCALGKLLKELEAVE